MSSAAEDLLKRHRLTVSDYHRMAEAGILHEDARVELIEGEIIDMSPIGSIHAGTVRQLSRLLERAVGEAAIVSAQNLIVLDDHSEPEPDIALLRPRADFYKSSHPRPGDVLLIIEVAEFSLRYDRDVKIPLYARHKIAEAWLIDVENGHLTIFLQPAGGVYQDILTPKSLATVVPSLLPGATLNLTELF
jgi:Uma2 family endonuclease